MTTRSRPDGIAPEQALRRARRVNLLLSLLAVGLLAGLAAAVLARRTPPPGSSEAVEELRQRMGEAGYAEGIRLLHQLGRSGGPAAESAILDLLRQAKNDRVRLAAITQLGRVGSRAAVEELQEIVASSQRQELRLRALVALGQIGSEEAVDALAAAAESDDLRVRRGALAALGVAGGERATATLRAQAQKRDGELRLAAIDGLGTIGSDEAVSALLGLLKDPSQRIQERAVSALGESGNPAARSALIRLAQDAGARTLRLAAVQALSGFSGDEVPVLLASLAASEDRELASAALRGLGESDSALAQQALAKAAASGQHDDSVVAALARSGTPEARQTLIQMLAEGREPHGVATALASLRDPEARRALLQAAQQGSFATQRAVIGALGQLRGPDVEKVLSDLTTSGSAPVAAAALRQLASQRGKEALPLLLAAYRDGNHQVSAAAIREIAALGDPSTKELLLEAARSGAYNLADAGVDGLAKLAGQAAAPTLIDLLENGPDATRGSVTYALGKLGGPEARGALLKALENERTGYSAAWALGQLAHDPETVAALERMIGDRSATEQTRQQALRALAYTGKTDALLKAAGSQDSAIADAALREAARIGGPEVEATLLDTLASGKDRSKKELALGALGQMATPRAVDTLTRSLRDPELFSTAAQSLAQIGGKQALESLHQRYRSGSADDRQTIIQSLGSHPGSPGVKTMLLSALSDGDDKVAETAAGVLARSGGADVKPRLIALLQSSSNASLRYRLASYYRWADKRVYEEHKALIDKIYAGNGE